ncbi:MULTISPECIES: hypothetical protein [Diaphorobacter]|jgi:hypothetical protein|uniref:hypothetical protein n=1 Tax=Diaphorobacter TaxID=238749 RepID=UPI0002FB422A|nr:MULTISPECIES: hypothetical protein [Diaphorobacter]QPN30504.1 hypothetical protein I3K84_17175 [Diaphorobacter sp. JS3051]TFI48237.1 hypothetical protein E4O93_08525 [Diaphorobacter sp. DS2]
MQSTSNTPVKRAPSIVGIRASAARHARIAVETLAEVARDASAPTAERVKAAETLLAYSTVPKVE